MNEILKNVAKANYENCWKFLMKNTSNLDGDEFTKVYNKLLLYEKMYDKYCFSFVDFYERMKGEKYVCD